MPLEILEKIIGFAIPERVIVKATYPYDRLPEQLEPFEWFDWSDIKASAHTYIRRDLSAEQKWDPNNILLISRLVHWATLRTLSTRVEFRVCRAFGCYGYGDRARFPTLKPLIRRPVVEHFKKLFAKAAE
jgi:hypothetical protein